MVTQPVHHQGIPDGSEKRTAKILVHIRETAPDVEIRPLAAYESIVGGDVCNEHAAGDRATAWGAADLGLKAVDARLENLLEQASKEETNYADFLDGLLWDLK